MIAGEVLADGQTQEMYAGEQFDDGLNREKVAGEQFAADILRCLSQEKSSPANSFEKRLPVKA